MHPVVAMSVSVSWFWSQKILKVLVLRSSFGSDLGQLYFILFCEPCLVQFCHLGRMRRHAVTETLSFHFSPLKSNQFILEPKKTFVTNLRKFPRGVFEISVHKNGMDGGTVNPKTQCVQLWLSRARMHKNTWHLNTVYLAGATMQTALHNPTMT